MGIDLRKSVERAIKGGTSDGARRGWANRKTGARVASIMAIPSYASEAARDPLSDSVHADRYAKYPGYKNPYDAHRKQSGSPTSDAESRVHAANAILTSLNPKHGKTSLKKSGNSEGAKRGWETRRRGGAALEEKGRAEVERSANHPADWHSAREPGKGDDITHDKFSGKPIVKLIPGPKNPTFGGWYQHSKVSYGGKVLEGHVQTRRRGGRTETHTGHDGAGVIGTDVEWLKSSNQAKEAGRKQPWHK